MRGEHFWLETLPVEAEERKLLAAYAADLPPAGARNRGWSALCATVGVGATTAAFSATASATCAGAAGSAVPIGTSEVATGTLGTSVISTTAPIAAKGVLSSVGMSIAAKSIAIGFVAGMSALGTARLMQKPEPARRTSIVAAVPTASPSVVRSMPKPRAAGTVAPTASATAAPTASATAPLTFSVPTAQPSRIVRPVADEAMSDIPPVAGNALSAQAEALAKIKLLLVAGEKEQAVTRLRMSVENQELSAVAEDRDALYIEALAETGRITEAKRAAQRFMALYPRSPHRIQIGDFIGNE